MPPGASALLAVGAGLPLGSFAVTVGLRMSRAQPWAAGRSVCDHCGKTLGFGQTVPVLSYVVQRGACRHCGRAIDPLHLAGEMAGVAVIGLAVTAPGVLPALFLAGLGLVLIAATAVDLRVQRLPNALTALAAGLGLALAAATRGVSGLAAGAVAATLAVLLLVVLRRFVRRAEREPGLGLGDVKLVGALALWLGAATPLMIAIAAGLGLAAGVGLRLRGRIAFGPFLALAAWLVGAGAQAGWIAWGW